MLRFWVLDGIWFKCVSPEMDDWKNQTWKQSQSPRCHFWQPNLEVPPSFKILFSTIWLLPSHGKYLHTKSSIFTGTCIRVFVYMIYAYIRTLCGVVPLTKKHLMFGQTLAKSFHSRCHTTLYLVSILICTRNIKLLFLFSLHQALGIYPSSLKKQSPPWDYDMFSRESLSSPGNQQMDALADGQLCGTGLAKVRRCSELRIMRGSRWRQRKNCVKNGRITNLRLGSKSGGGEVYQISGLPTPTP